MTTTAERLASGTLNARLPLSRLRHQPRWLVDDLAPMRRELRRPIAYVQSVLLWLRVRQAGFTMLGCRRARTLHRLARLVDRTAVPGALVDCGVWNGGSTAILSAGAPGREVWACDSFEGLPAPDERDGAEAAGWEGSCLGRQDNVIEAVRRFADPARLHLVEGWFDETLHAAAGRIGSIAVLHADGDWYDSVMVTLESLYPRVASGGFVVVDDYGVWAGARAALDDFRAREGIAAPLRHAAGSAYWRKP